MHECYRKADAGRDVPGSIPTVTNTEPGHDEDARLHSWRRLMDPDASGLVEAAMDATGKGVEPRLVSSAPSGIPGCR